MMSDDEWAGRFQILVSSEEGKRLFLQSADKHRDKAAMYRQQAERVMEGVPGSAVPGSAADLDAEEGWQEAYTSSTVQNVKQVVNSLLDRARQNEKKAALKTFIADHLADGVHEISAQELERFGLFD